jgi:hypothetical protein
MYSTEIPFLIIESREVAKTTLYTNKFNDVIHGYKIYFYDIIRCINTTLQSVVTYHKNFISIIYVNVLSLFKKFRHRSVEPATGLAFW